MDISETGLDFINRFILKIEPRGPVSLVKLGRARLEWIDLRRRALDEIERLSSVIEAVYAEDVAAKSAVTGALGRLGVAIAQLNADLEDQLDAVLNADDGARKPLVSRAMATTNNFMTLCASDPIISTIDGNEFTPDMAIVGPMHRKLAEVNASLGA